jgi:hypothetical protein
VTAVIINSAITRAETLISHSSILLPAASAAHA